MTGVTGQDGSYLVDMLLRNGYAVTGVTRSWNDPKRVGILDEAVGLARLPQNLTEWERLLADVQPHELYHLAADSFVPSGWQNPLENLNCNTALTVQILEALRRVSPQTRLLNACSREIFGNRLNGLANEDSEMRPTTPYGINKAASRSWVLAYRNQYALFASNAILFNHESPRRGPDFVTRKITKRVAEISFGLEHRLELGNISAQKDWGFAQDFVQAMWMILQQNSAEDFVIGTGVLHTIEFFVQQAFGHAGLDWREYVQSDPEQARTNDTAVIAADISKARRVLGWEPTVGVPELARMMVDADLHLLRTQQSVREAA